jgi:hypothetical protein
MAYGWSVMQPVNISGSVHPPKTVNGLNRSRPEILRCLRHQIAREAFPLLTA